MRKKKILLICAVLFFLTAIFLAIFFIKYKAENNKNLSKDNLNTPINYVSGVVPHHLLANSIIERFFQELSKSSHLKEIVLLSPDHFNKAALYGNKLITSSSSIKIDDDLLNKNLEIISEQSVLEDHGITNILPYITKYFPDAKIIPFLIPAEFSIENSKIFTEELNSLLMADSFVLASVDFSHYLSKDIADFHDQKSLRVLLNFEEENFSNIEVDCPQCLYVARYFAKLRGKENYFVIDHKNSQDFSTDKNLQSTTSYFSVLFGDKNNISNGDFNNQTLLFVGDMMFDRGIEYEIKKNSLLFPFEKIESVLRGIDYVVGNLEGLIVNKPIDYGSASLTFNFDKNIIDGLKFGHFNVLSLANNHTLNANSEGLLETRQILRDAEINYFGDPTDCNEKDAFSKGNIVFIGVNQTYPFNCNQEKTIGFIKDIREKNPDKLLVVFIHWGLEYQSATSISQENLGHILIDSGVDLIVGSHSHVVQKIEQYKGKYIAYSLGNFIFDQNFSEETSEGLMLRVVVKGKNIINAEPIKIDFTKYFQPELINSGK